jgi:hypothetical protein
LIHPILLYGSETMGLTKKEENRLPVFERKVLLTIYGPKIVDGGQTKPRKTEIQVGGWHEQR